MRTLIVVGLVSIGFAWALSMFFHWSVQFWPPEAMEQTLQWWAPPTATVAMEVTAYQGGWSEQMPMRVSVAVMFQTFVFLVENMWRAGGLMLIGMALFKLDVFSAKRSTRTYVIMILPGLLIGIPVIVYGVFRNFAAQWVFESCFYLGGQFNYWGSLLVALAWVSAVMLVCKHGLMPWLTRALAAVGQMAFTNYLMQTVICTTIFYGHGLGLFGRVDRMWHPLIIVAVWIVQLIGSPLWLAHFRFGPVEWLWRSLTYRKFQPMKMEIHYVSN